MHLLSLLRPVTTDCCYSDINSSYEPALYSGFLYRTCSLISTISFCSSAIWCVVLHSCVNFPPRTLHVWRRGTGICRVWGKLKSLIRLPRTLINTWSVRNSILWRTACQQIRLNRTNDLRLCSSRRQMLSRPKPTKSTNNLKSFSRIILVLRRHSS